MGAGAEGLGAQSQIWKHLQTNSNYNLVGSWILSHSGNKEKNIKSCNVFSHWANVNRIYYNFTSVVSLSSCCICVSFPQMKNTKNRPVWVIYHAPLLYYQTAVRASFPNFVITSGSGSFIIKRELSKGKNNLDFITSTNQF